MAAERRTLVIEHDTSGFLRGDTKSRMEAYSLAINSGIMTQNEARIRENLNPVPGGDVLRYPLNMAEVSEDTLRSAPFLSGAERRSAEDAIAALKFTGVREKQYRALVKGITIWLREDGTALMNYLSKQPECRSSLEAGYSLLGKVKSYYADLEAYMPEELQRAIDDISVSAYQEIVSELKDDAPSREWFNGRLKFFYGDEMKRLKHVNEQEVETIIRSAIGQDKPLWGILNQRISGWPEERAEKIAQNEAAFTRNKMLIRTIRKAGYLAVWHTAPSCCPLCQKMNGQVVTTLSPPLHNGCCCTVKRGGVNKGDYGYLPEDKGLKESLEHVILWMADDQFGKKLGKHLHEFGLSETSASDREKYRQIIDETFSDYDEQRLIEWDYDPATGKRTIEVLGRKKADVLVLTRLDGRFITAFPKATLNNRYLNGRVVR